MATSGIELNDGIVSSLDIGRTFDDNSQEISSMVFSDNGAFLYTSSLDDNLNIYKIDQGRRESSIYCREYGIGTIAYPHIENQILCSTTRGSEYNIRRWDLDKNEIISNFSGHNYSISSLIMSPKNDEFVSSEPGLLLTWDIRAPRLVGKCRFATHDIQGSLAYDPTGTILALGYSSGRNSVVKLFSTAKMTLGAINMWEFPTPLITQLEFSNNGIYLLVMTKFNSLYIVNAFTGNIIQEITEFNNESGQCAATFTTDGNYVLVSDETHNGVFAYKATGEKVCELKGHHPNIPSQLKWSPEHVLMASSCTNLVLWAPDFHGLHRNNSL